MSTSHPSRHSAESAEELLTRYRASGDRRLRNQVVDEHRWLAATLARAHQHGGEPIDDLIQVACMGVLKAAERFDPSFGVQFRTYAAATATGELRRHYRDTGWSLRVPRRLQELRYEVRAATDVLRERLSRPPMTSELAEYLHVEIDEIIDCLCADSNIRSLSIDRPGADDRVLVDGSTEARYAEIEMLDAFHELSHRLPARLARIVEMRFVGQLTQAEIAAVVGLSQVHVGRLLQAAISKLRTLVERRGLVAP